MLTKMAGIRGLVAAVALSGLCSLGPVTGAGAATVGADATDPLGAAFRGSPAETNDVVIASQFLDGQSLLSVSDAGAALSPGTGCTAGSPVFCTFTSLSVDLGGSSDRARVRTYPFGNTQVDGGAGNDDIAVDNLGSGYAAFGGSGNDRLWVSSDSGASADGGPGDDLLGGGGDGGGTLAAGDGRDFIAGVLHAGSLQLDGGDGRDTLVGTATTRMGQGSMSGGSGDDLIIVAPAPQVAPAPPWTIDGGRGDDYVALGSDATTTATLGPGDDVVDARGNGAADTITCGPGRDTVYADPSDVVDRSCERIVQRQAPPRAGVAQAVARAQAFIAEPRFSGSPFVTTALS